MSASRKKKQRTDIFGQDMTEKQKKELKEQKSAKTRNIIYGIMGVVIAALVALLLVWNSGFFDRLAPALTVKDTKYSAADVNYFYQQALNSAYSQDQTMAQYYQQLGMEYTPSFDPAADLTTQFVDEEKTQSYHQLFLDNAKTSLTQLTALCDAANTAGYQLTQEGKDQIAQAMTSMDKSIAEYNYGSRTAYLRAVYGISMTEKIYKQNMERNVLASEYYTSVKETMTDYSDADLEAFYKENPNTLDSYTYNYCYLDGTAPSTTDAEGNSVPATDEAKAEAMKVAKENSDALLAAVQGGEAFATAAATYTTSTTAREQVMGSTFSTATYGEWLMDSTRKDGDVSVFEVEDAGYYVIQYNSRARNEDPTADIRHILISTEIEDDAATSEVDESATAPTEEFIAEKKAEAQAILDTFKAGEHTEEAFAALAEEHSADGRDAEGKLNAPGGLFEKVAPGDMVATLDAWIFEQDHAVGDTDLVETEFGWHVVYFQGENVPTWKIQASTEKSTADEKAWMEGIEAGYEAVEGSAFAKVGK